jgi:hypothetical protein
MQRFRSDIVLIQYVSSPGLAQRLREFSSRQQSRSSQGGCTGSDRSQGLCWDLSPRLCTEKQLSRSFSQSWYLNIQWFGITHWSPEQTAVYSINIINRPIFVKKNSEVCILKGGNTFLSISYMISVVSGVNTINLRIRCSNTFKP